MSDLFTDLKDKRTPLPFFYRREVMRKEDADWEFLDNAQLHLEQAPALHEYSKAEDVYKVIERWNVIGAAQGFPKWRYRLISKEEYDASN